MENTSEVSMAVTAPASLDSTALSRRLGELAGHERQLQLDFLLHLDEFDRRRAWAEAGYPSLWEWCLRVLHLREGAAGRRIAAMRVLRRFPALADALRDGRLCLSTVALLGPVLTEENCAEIVDRAAFKTRAETEHLVASLQPRTPPKEGLRLLPTPRSSAPAPRAAPPPRQEPCASQKRPEVDQLQAAEISACPPRRASRSGFEPVSESHYSLRVTVDRAFKQEFEQLKALLAHKIPDGDFEAVLREAIGCSLAMHAKRKGAVEPSRKRKSPPPKKSDLGEKHRPAARERIPTAVRREVWRRDGGRCAWRGPDGHVCGSTWKVEVDHIRPVALGGASTVDNCRLLCQPHNQLHAEQTFGRAHMERCRRKQPRTGEVASAGGSGGTEGGSEVGTWVTNESDAASRGLPGAT
jgi:5-methylcytosine-specific restriction endonuclease McrA